MPASDERRFQALILAPVRRVQRRLNSVAWTEAGVVPLWAAATACLLARLLLREAALWLIPLPLLAGLAWWAARARARSISLTHAAILADRSVSAGGLLLTRLERPLGEWELAANQLARAIQPPRVNWQRPTSNLLTALAFLAFALTLPLPAPRTRPPSAAAAAKVAAVQAKAEALVREEPLGAPVEEELRRLAEEVAEGRFDETDWEGADALEATLAARAAEAAAELAAAAEAARNLEEALDSAMSAEAASREREALESALMELGQDGSSSQQGEPQGAGSGQGAASSGGADGGTGSGQAGQGSGSGRTPGTRDKVADLRRSLEQRRQSLEQRFGQQGNGTGSGSRPGTARRPGSGQGQGQEQGQGQGQGQGRGDHLSRQVKKGEGGAGRGGESQPLQFGEKAEMDPERLAFQPLPPGQGDEPQQLWGLRAVDPRRPGTSAVPGSAPGAPAPGEATPGHGTAPLLPRNRELVKRYFGGPP